MADVIEAEIINEKKPKYTRKKVGVYTATIPRGKKLGQKHITPKKWVEIMQYYISGHSVVETCEKYHVPQQTLFYQLKKRDLKKFPDKELTDEDIAELDKEPEFADRIREELAGAKKRFETMTTANKEEIGTIETIANEATRLKIYDEVLPILKEKNPILAKNLSAISAKVMLRANTLLDQDLTPRDLRDVASALACINDILQIIPKTQPLIAQQFNIGAKQEEKTTPKNVDIKVEFV